MLSTGPGSGRDHVADTADDHDEQHRKHEQNRQQSVSVSGGRTVCRLAVVHVSNVRARKHKSPGPLSDPDARQGGDTRAAPALHGPVKRGQTKLCLVAATAGSLAPKLVDSF